MFIYAKKNKNIFKKHYVRRLLRALLVLINDDLLERLTNFNEKVIEEFSDKKKEGCFVYINKFTHIHSLF